MINALSVVYLHIILNEYLLFQGTVIQTSQGVQIQGIKRYGQATTAGGLVTKKVIIATINGTQRILTPVSSPHVIAMKTSPRLLSDGTIINGSSPFIIQKPVTQINKPKQLNSPVQNSRSTDNKTCLWKFENGQVSFYSSSTKVQRAGFMISL